MGFFSKPPKLEPGQVPCPHCKWPLQWSQPNEQWYCNRCDLFVAPDGQREDALKNLATEIEDIVDSKPKYYCEVCKARLDWSQEHSRWFCSRCRTWK